MADFSIFIYLYILSLFILIISYVKLHKHRDVILGIASILSTATLAIGFLNYYNSEKNKYELEKKSNQKNYIDFISGSFDKIDNYYINNPKELHSLYYEFYGYNNFPEKYDEDKKEYTNETKSDNITAIEYITLLKIIQYIEIMFIINENIFKDLNFRNRIINYTNSKKLKHVLSYNRNNYSQQFLNKMLELKIINNDEIQVENIPVPKLN
jgi:hypothetical protein